MKTWQAKQAVTVIQSVRIQSMRSKEYSLSCFSRTWELTVTGVWSVCLGELNLKCCHIGRVVLSPFQLTSYYHVFWMQDMKLQISMCSASSQFFSGFISSFYNSNLPFWDVKIFTMSVTQLYVRKYVTFILKFTVS